MVEMMKADGENEESRSKGERGRGAARESNEGIGGRRRCRDKGFGRDAGGERTMER